MLAIQALLRNSIDYAGLFPPAELDLDTAIRNYAEYRQGEDAWALARLIVPAGRLTEFSAKAARMVPGSELHRWQLAALVGPDLVTALSQVAAFNDHAGRSGARVDTIEVKASSVAAVEDTLSWVPDSLQTYVEIPIQDDPVDLVGAIALRGSRAKVRTGGVTQEAFPQGTDLVRFMATCTRAGVPFKATAGLHHAIRSRYRLTYAPDSQVGLMFGFLNVFLAAALLDAGASEREALALLEETSAQAFQVDDGQVAWGAHFLELADLERARHRGLISFGSCSFTEPLADLRTLGLVSAKAQRV